MVTLLSNEIKSFESKTDGISGQFSHMFRVVDKEWLYSNYNLKLLPVCQLNVMRVFWGKSHMLMSVNVITISFWTNYQSSLQSSCFHHQENYVPFLSATELISKNPWTCFSVADLFLNIAQLLNSGRSVIYMLNMRNAV